MDVQGAAGGLDALLPAPTAPSPQTSSTRGEESAEREQASVIGIE